MGNAALCTGQRPTGRVTRPDGSVEEFVSPVQVSQLTSQYPDYLVVHCSNGHQSLGERRRISVLELQDRLVPGHSYIMYPIPSELKQSFLSCGPISQEEKISGSRYSSSKKAQSSETKRMMATRRRKKSLPIKVLVQCFSQMLKGQSTERDPDVMGAKLLPLLNSRQMKGSAASKEDSELEEHIEQMQKKLVLSLEPYMWRPALECIPESPGSHDGMPDSPFAFQQRTERCTRFQSPLLLETAMSCSINSIDQCD